MLEFHIDVSTVRQNAVLNYYIKLKNQFIDTLEDRIFEKKNNEMDIFARNCIYD
jgi:hypothetical protein